MRARSGTLTFMFTDIEGSARLWETHPEAMPDALARHDALLNDAVRSNGGEVVKTTGDGFFATFGTAQQAVSAAIAAQLSLGSERWETTGPIRVRMGLHCGDAVLDDGDYHGPAVNRTARLTSAAHGGQVLLSGAAAALVADRLPSGAELLVLGEHRLRDLGRPEVLYQLAFPGLAQVFPALRTLDSYPGNLPLQVSSFIGREREVARVLAALEEARIVTLTGVGGVGKTRLALQVAARVLPQFREGAWVVELAPVRDPGGVPTAVAAVFGITERSGLTLETTMAEFFRTKQLVLVLDNCEHLLEEVAELVETLERSCARLVILATSREGLALEGERVVPVPSLPSPAFDASPQVAMQADAVRLFVERATGVDPDFSLTNANSPAVVQVCRRLDGIPLAIELAAARVGATTLTELVRGLQRRFETLTGGRRRAVQRHQTLRAAIDWSYDLLGADERRLLGRLSVFAGGCSRQAAEAVCGSEPLAPERVFDLLAALVAKSLVVAQRDEPETRYRLLETIREYADERLLAEGENLTARAAHAHYYRDAVERLDVGRFGPGQYEVFRFLGTEQENLLAAFNHAIDTIDVDLGLRLVRSTMGVGQMVTSQVTLPIDVVLGLPGAADHPLYPVGLTIAAVRAAMRGELDGVESACEEATTAARRLACDDDQFVDEMVSVARMAMAMSTGHWRTAADHGDRAVALTRAAGRPLLAMRLSGVAVAYTMAGDPDAALPLATEGLELARQDGTPRWIAMNLMALAGALADRDNSRARAALRESVEIHDHLSFWGPQEATQATLIAARISDWTTVLKLAPLSIRQLHWSGDRPQLAGIFNAVSRAVASTNDEAAAVLQGAARRLARATMTTGSPGAASTDHTDERVPARHTFSFVTELRRQTTVMLRQTLDDARLGQLRAEGEAMDGDQAVAHALEAIAQSATADRNS